MLSKLTTSFLSPYKLYLYAALAAGLLVLWGLDRHAQYNKGKNECQLKQAEAEAAYFVEKNSRLVLEGKLALKEEQRVGTTITERKASRAKQVEKSVELSKASPNGACVLTDLELLDIQAAIREANGKPVVVPPVSPASL